MSISAAETLEWLFHPQYGLLNQVLSAIGIGPLHFLQEPTGVILFEGLNATPAEALAPGSGERVKTTTLFPSDEPQAAPPAPTTS